MVQMRHSLSAAPTLAALARPKYRSCAHAEALSRAHLRGSAPPLLQAQQAFLSRLLLLLGSFVILCLLLF